MSIITRTIHNTTLNSIQLLVPGYDTVKPPVIISASTTVDLFTVLTGDELEAIQPLLAEYVATGEFSVIATVDTATFNPVGGGGGGFPAGSNTQVQFNDNGVFGASPNFTFDKTTNSLSLGATTLGVATLEVTSASIYQSLDFFEIGYDSGLPPPQAASLFSVGVYGSAAQGGVYMLATNALTLADNTVPAFGMEAHIGNPTLADAIGYYLVGTKNGSNLANTDKLFVLNNAYNTDLVTVFGNGNITAVANIDALTYSVNGNAGVSGSFTTADSKTVTVTNGLITSIV